MIYDGPKQETNEPRDGFTKYANNEVVELPLDDYSGRYSDGYSGDIEHGDYSGEMSDSLEHHGIAGQKWGVRQGPPYPLASKASRTIHYNVGKMTEKTKAAYQKTKAAAASRKAAKAEAKTVKVQAKAAKKEAKAEAKKAKETNVADIGPKKFTKSQQRISEMSSEELKARIERLKLEEEYRKWLNGGQAQQQKVQNGQHKADSILHDVGKELVVGLARTTSSRIDSRLRAKTQAKLDAKKRRMDLRKQMLEDERNIRNAERKAEAATYGAEMGKSRAKWDTEMYEHNRDIERKDWYTNRRAMMFDEWYNGVQKDEQSRQSAPRLYSSTTDNYYTGRHTHNSRRRTR